MLVVDNGVLVDQQNATIYITVSHNELDGVSNH